MNTEQARDLLAEWARQGQEAAPPAWEELPGIPLYMDQVILYLGESLELFQREGSSLLTSSMINNYVKTGLIPHPDKKKYTKEHLAGLMAVCMLKQVLPIQDIKTLFSGGMDPTPTPCSARPTPRPWRKPAAAWRKHAPAGRT